MKIVLYLVLVSYHKYSLQFFPCLFHFHSFFLSPAFDVVSPIHSDVGKSVL